MYTDDGIGKWNGQIYIYGQDHNLSCAGNITQKNSAALVYEGG